ncbi:MAG: hypothetical protein JJW01_03705 [Alphaproteobacteria bacterium]|nr:hypothetical protein [Rickettsiales bacterium]
MRQVQNIFQHHLNAKKHSKKLENSIKDTVNSKVSFSDNNSESSKHSWRQESFLKNNYCQESEPQNPHLPVAGEIGLFRAIIMQALIDCVNHSKRTEDKLAKQQALEWFREDNTDFILVCQFAQLNHNWVLQQSIAAIKNGCKRKYSEKTKPNINKGQK